MLDLRSRSAGQDLPAPTAVDKVNGGKTTAAALDKPNSGTTAAQAENVEDKVNCGKALQLRR